LLQESGYPKYRRRASSPSVTKGRHQIDARDVVPYNPYLSKRYKCHLNVEYCGIIKAVKYLFKYTYKGHDRASLQVSTDEVQRFVDARYVGPPESCWRLFQFPMHDSSHTVVRLPVHLPNDQMVTWVDGEERRAVEEALKKDTMLMAYFKLNAEAARSSSNLPSAAAPGAHGYKGKGKDKNKAKQKSNQKAPAVDPRTLRYGQIPEYYTWDRQACRWKPRERQASADRVIGRLHGAQPSEGDRYYMYILLLHVTGATSFDNLRGGPHKDADGNVIRTFQQQAIDKGLLSSDDEYHRAMRDAAFDQSPPRLRTLLAHILLHCEIKSGKELWDAFADEMMYERQDQRKNEDAAKFLALRHVRAVLEQYGKTLKDFGLTMPNVDESALDNVHREAQKEKDYDKEEQRSKAVELRGQMYPEQAVAFDKIMDDVSNKSPGCYFIDGPGGAGKTFLYEALLHSVRGQGWIGLACAWSGIAAVLLQGGRTCHSRFGLPVPMPRDSVTSSIKAQSGRAALLKEARLILWDEAPMAPKEALEAVDVLLRDLCDHDS
jgi:hypothetical protein